jgi:SAM-dependent methyltransferase
MEGMQSAEKVRKDFDRLADLSDEGGWDHNAYYHPFLLGQLPPRCSEALEVGCGTGAFARSLADRSERVVAIDLSPRMVEVARNRAREHPNVEYVVADANFWEFPVKRFDCVASITTLHHLPLAPTIRKMRDALRPGGTLLLLDLYRARSVADYLTGALGFPASKALGLAKTGSFANRQSLELRRAWEEHGRMDTYHTMTEVRRVRDAELPGAAVRRHLLWRYSMVWRKPAS